MVKLATKMLSPMSWGPTTPDDQPTEADSIKGGAMPEETRGNAEDEEYDYRQDAIGRWYKYDSWGNCIYSNPLR